MPTRYQRLDAVAVKDTVDALQRRIAARFPERNLPKVAAEVSATIDELLIRPQPRWYGVLSVASRALIGVLAGSLVAVLAIVLIGAQDDPDTPRTWEWASIIESMVNDLVFVGVAVFFLWHVPTRIQRAHHLQSLHKLRSLAHIIDMHQLTKDPERLSVGYRPTARSIEMGMDIHDLWSYLDYCSELLSLVGKAAALFAESNNDQTVLATVEGIEDLTTGMSRKIWQKISLLRATPLPAGTVRAATPPAGP